MRIILVGYGTVARSLTQLFLERRRLLREGFGLNPRVVAAIDRGGAAINPRGLSLERLLEVKASTGSVANYPGDGHPGMEPRQVIREVEAEVVVETLPTNLEDGQPALAILEEAFKAGLHVVTTDKGPLALALPALIELAAYNRVAFRFSGTVGGGTPILEFGKRCLVADRLKVVEGILNGTTNYILTAMERRGLEFEDALKEAQRLGYAEADPSLDIDGWDTAAKVVIIANWLMGRRVTLKDVRVRGIRGLEVAELAQARRQGRTIKLLGRVGEDSLTVAPEEVGLEDPLNVAGTLNAVRFRTETAGDETLIGRGAGGPETASAVIRDLIWVGGKTPTG
jgi:homoserine dehydrogenase